MPWLGNCGSEEVHEISARTGSVHPRARLGASTSDGNWKILGAFDWSPRPFKSHFFNKQSRQDLWNLSVDTVLMRVSCLEGGGKKKSED